MILGLLAGEWLKAKGLKSESCKDLCIAGAALVLLGLICQWAGICPIVKRVWTSSYTLYSGGLVVLILAGFYADDGMERMAAVGVSSRRRWHELDCRLRNELDHGGFLQQSLGPSLRASHRMDFRPDLSARAARLCHRADLLVHPVLDVSPQIVLEDLSGSFALAQGHPAGSC